MEAWPQGGCSSAWGWVTDGVLEEQCLVCGGDMRTAWRKVSHLLAGWWGLHYFLFLKKVHGILQIL